MRLNALLGVTLVEHEAAEDVDVLVELTAPEMVTEDSRALASLVHRSEPTDRFGVVTFDDEAKVVVPTGPQTDKARVLGQIAGVEARGTTEPSGTTCGRCARSSGSGATATVTPPCRAATERVAS